MTKDRKSILVKMTIVLLRLHFTSGHTMSWKGQRVKFYYKLQKKLLVAAVEFLIL